MGLLRNEDGISEVVGAMLILMMLVLYLGMLQAYEVPKWNEELEREQFDRVYSDFINLRSDIEDVSIKNIPKTSNLHMGIRYPERFLLRNPGPGAGGILTTYPLDVNVSYTSLDGSISYANYTSNGVTYELRGVSTFPKLVYEHGITIRSFENVNLTDNQQGLMVNNEIFLPVVNWRSISASSIETESLNIKPYNTTISSTKNIRITLSTRYPELWKELLKNTQANVSGDRIIINISSYIGRDVLLPIVDMPAENAIYTGMIKFSRSSSSPFEVPPFSNSDPTQPNWPVIMNISLESVTTGDPVYQRTHSNIIAIVKNVTGPSYIHADLTGLSRDTNSLAYNVQPDYFPSNNWSLPNSNTVRWSSIEHPDYDVGSTVSIALWVVNPTNNMQYYTERTYTRKNSQPYWQ